MVFIKYSCFCSIIVTLLVLSTDMNAKVLELYLKPDSSNRLSRLLNSSETLRQNSSIPHLSRWCSLVRASISSSSYAIVNSILASVSMQFLSSVQLTGNQSQHERPSIESNSSLNARKYGPMHSLNGFVSRSGTSFVHEKSRKVSSEVNGEVKCNGLQSVDLVTHSSSCPVYTGSNVPDLVTHSSSCPVYTGSNVPQYVFQYRLSGSKYRQLLAGLALYNLGAISSSQSTYRYHKHYVPKPNEVCKFGVKYDNGPNDEMAIDCRAITYFIRAEELSKKAAELSENSAVILDKNNAATKRVFNNIDVFTKYENEVFSNNKFDVNAGNYVITTDKLSETGHTVAHGVVNASDPIFYGKPVNITSNMECYVTGNMRSLSMKKAVPCHVLQEHTVGSINSSTTVMVKSLIMVALMLLFCYK